MKFRLPNRLLARPRCFLLFFILLVSCSSNPHDVDWPETPVSVECPEQTVPTERDLYTRVERTCLDSDGTVQGPAVSYWEPGVMVLLGHYHHGEKNGTWYGWNEDGNPYLVDKYEAGVLREHRIYYSTDSSQISFVSRWNQDEERHGEWASWYKDGQKATERHYCNGKGCGIWKFWGADGTLLNTYDFGKSDPIYVKWYRPDGTVWVEGGYSSGVPSGDWTWWERGPEDEPRRILQLCRVKNGEIQACRNEPDDGLLPMPP